MSREGLRGRERVVGFGVYNCCFPSARFAQRVWRKGGSSDPVYIGLCAVRARCASLHFIMRCS